MFMMNLYWIIVELTGPASVRAGQPLRRIEGYPSSGQLQMGINSHSFTTLLRLYIRVSKKPGKNE